MDFYNIAVSLLSQGSYAILSFAVGYLLNKERGNKAKREKTECGIRALLKTELRRIHERGQTEHKLSYADEASAEEIYATYHALGGNGQGTTMINEIRKMPKV
jgi:hypothetical protein|nr:MAG TPA: minor structural protein [Caudoviricetes sp.]DAV75687.1 MAG TPA: minor structural protein [Caudoviricetes sp.]